MNIKKLTIGITLIAMILIPASTQLVSGENAEITIKVTEGDVVKVTTEKMTVVIIPNQAHLMWWYGSKSKSDETFKLQFVKIREFFGADTVLDDCSEFNNNSFKLIKNDWEYLIEETEEDLTITLSLLDFLNGADMYIVMHIYNYDTPIPDTNDIVDALSELKFDIIIDDWVFSEGAQGYAIQSYLTEIEHKNKVSLRNGTVAENGTLKRTMEYISNQYNYDIVAYYEWLNYANIYDNADTLIDTVDVGTAYFDCLKTPPPEAPDFAEGLAHLYLTYPNYGDDNKMVHDPTIGVIEPIINVNEPAYTASIPLYLFPVIGGLFVTAVIVLVVKRKK
ncbi:MAG: hypothetical protein HZR80_00720 [Candidatus Heimdallarchaeota archaeon]